MKKIISLIAVIIVVSVFYSCAPAHIIVTRPVAVTEVVTPAPGPSYVWVNYEYRWDGAKWAYMPGHWEPAPYANAVWTQGHWHRVNNGYHWVPGHWD